MAREIVQRFEVVYEPDEEGFHVYVPVLKGCPCERLARTFVQGYRVVLLGRVAGRTVSGSGVT